MCFLLSSQLLLGYGRAFNFIYHVQFTSQALAGNHEEYEKLAKDLTNMANTQANTLALYVIRLRHAAALDASWSECQMPAQASGVSDKPCRTFTAEYIDKQRDCAKIMRTVEVNQDQGDGIAG